MVEKPTRRNQVSSMSSSKATPVLAGVVFSFLILVQSAQAQSPVEERSVRPAGAAASSAQPTPNPVLDLYVDLQELREEVQRLNGVVEELTYELARAKSVQATDYANLDSRLLQLSQSSAGVAPETAANGQAMVPSAQAVGSTPAAEQADGQQEAAALYSEALAALRAGNASGAVELFDRLVQTYPANPLVGDSYYWIGETHWVAGRYEQAREAYAGLVNGFADNRKFGESLYKLGRVYVELGDVNKAREYLQKAQAQGGDVADRASELLAEIR